MLTPVEVASALYSAEARQSSETGALADDPIELQCFADLLTLAPDEDTRLPCSCAEVKLRRFARWHAAQYRKRSEPLHLRALETAQKAYAAPQDD